MGFGETGDKLPEVAPGFCLILFKELRTVINARTGEETVEHFYAFPPVDFIRHPGVFFANSVFVCVKGIFRCAEDHEVDVAENSFVYILWDAIVAGEADEPHCLRDTAGRYAPPFQKFGHPDATQFFVLCPTGIIDCIMPSERCFEGKRIFCFLSDCAEHSDAVPDMS